MHQESNWALVLLITKSIDCRADYLKTDNEDRIQTCDNLALDSLILKVWKLSVSSTAPYRALKSGVIS